LAENAPTFQLPTKCEKIVTKKTNLPLADKGAGLLGLGGGVLWTHNWGQMADPDFQFGPEIGSTRGPQNGIKNDSTFGQRSCEFVGNFFLKSRKFWNFLSGRKCSKTGATKKRLTKNWGQNMAPLKTN